MTDDSKCLKCGSKAVEIFQRGKYVSGMRCLACSYETIARSCRTVDELRSFIEGLPGEAMLMFQDDFCYPKLEAHFSNGQLAKAEKVKMWKGTSKE